ncbi:hypothetical protein CC80DRAFT_493966 [Byssothecium circinans]|uniref:BRCT domain-containing protein n=1 Tax=Byssothecium circinans TaxID=147558 RepID=A0A6A5TYT7_9PLEO|nr:hypothetical protein CC80DRAFT_493966 [Byssothecium circinans]
MYQTFDGVVDVPGDTQPDSQMFKQYTSGLLESKSGSDLIPNPPPLCGEDDVSAHALTDEIEILGSSQSQCSPAITSPTAIHDDPETQYRINDTITSPLKFETPAVAGRKRDSHGQVLSSAVRTDTTPGTVLSASAFFGFGNGGSANAISLTQVFNATQAATSPIVGAPSEDPVFQRPSPNFVRRSSPSAAMSSPIKSGRNEPSTSPPLRSSSEPRADYETIKQSQERRSRGPPGQNTSEEAHDSFEMPTAAQLRFRKQMEKSAFEQEAARSLAGVSAPPPTNRRGRKRGRQSTKAHSKSPESRTMRKKALSNGAHDSEADDPADELSQPMIGNGDNENHELRSQLSQDMPADSRISRRGAAPVNGDDVNNQVQVPNTSSHPLKTLSGQSARNLSQDAPSSQFQRESHFKVPSSHALHKSVKKLKSSRDNEIVMDSQPDPNADVPATPHPKERRFPSTPSPNQYSINQTTMQGNTGFTSQVVSSSVPPMPPGSPAREDSRDESMVSDVERVPSSPPIVPQDDELTYDEHAYDEHSEAENASQEALGTREDVEMEDDEGLPVAPEKSNHNHVLSVEGADPSQLAMGDVEMHNDEEIPETIEHEELLDLHDEDEELTRSSHPEEDLHNKSSIFVAPSRAERQSTIPETDVLDETQPAFFSGAEGATPRNSHDEDDEEESTVDDTNSTGAFHTGKERQSASPAGKMPTSSAKASATLQSPAGPSVRSLMDIANQPATQRSTDPNDIEIPQLSFTHDAEDSAAFISASSPARPSKKRKITYSAKKHLRGPVEDTDPLSEPEFQSPAKHFNEESGWTPPLAPTQEREEQGALAAVRAREAVYAHPAATLKSRGLRKSNNPHTPRKGALKPVSRALITKTPEKISPQPVSRLSNTPAQLTPSIEVADSEANMRNAAGSAGTALEVLRDAPPIVTTTDDGEAPAGELVCPNRVFAHWPGKHFYPATCVGRAGLQTLRIRFDDGNETVLEPPQVRAFDLRLGDHVKVDEPGMKKNAYVVIGFKNKIDVSKAGESVPTDCHGYTTVVLEEKRRESLPAVKGRKIQKHIEVPMGIIYFTTTLWGRIRDRVYRHTPSSTPVASASHLGSPGPLDGSGLPTPTMGRRSALGMSLLRDTTARGTSIASSVRSSGTVFSNMAFAISFSKESSDKDGIARSITSNGGELLDSGFSELFDVDGSEDPDSSAGTAKVIPGLDGLLLRREYENLGFVAMISDAHSRRTKYIQALALNIPCLHPRWIYDSLAAARPLPFAKYLLPAGESNFLEPCGVVRSRNMTVYDPASDSVTFVRMLKERSLLLADQTVLVITGRMKKDIERKQPYIFLTSALGPSDVATCKDVAAAKDMVESGEWDWVYADGSEAAAILFGEGDAKGNAGRKKGAAGRKRKRDEEVEVPALVQSSTKGGKKVRVVGDEFVIQSLILGALIDD